MKRLINISLFCLLLPVLSWGQYGFQRVYNEFDLDTVSVISDIYVHGDSICFAGGGRSGIAHGLRFGKVDASGDITDLMRHDIPGHFQRAYFSGVDLDTNFRGNLVNVYLSRELDFSKIGFRLVEFNLEGDIVFDSLYTFLWDNDSIGLFDYSKLIHLEDSSYLINLNFSSQKETSPNYKRSGSFLAKFSSTGDTLWTKRYYSNVFNPPIKPSWLGFNFVKQTSNRFRQQINEWMHYAPANAELNWAKQHFLTVDTTGNIIEDKVFQDGQFCLTLGEAFFDGDTIYLQYYDSQLTGPPDHTDYFKVKPVLARIAPNMQLVWKKPLQNSWGTDGSYEQSIQRIRKINDTCFIGSHCHIKMISEPGEFPSLGTQKVRLYNFTNTGQFNWVRDYYYYSIDSLYDPSYDIKDIEIMPDGGFVVGGQSKNHRYASMGLPNQFAYLLRTNCLGFLAPPTAQFNATVNTQTGAVTFSNNSLNAGSYVWAFGDDSSLRTGEDQTTIEHTYAEGTYNVQLIAEGCNGEADTMQLEIVVSIEEAPEPEQTYGDIAPLYFKLYPNPIAQGGLITVETGQIEQARLLFYDAQGRKVKEVPLPKAKSIYFIEQNFASGIYTVHLVKDGELLQGEKIIMN